MILRLIFIAPWICFVACKGLNQAQIQRIAAREFDQQISEYLGKGNDRSGVIQIGHPDSAATDFEPHLGNGGEVDIPQVTEGADDLEGSNAHGDTNPWLPTFTWDSDHLDMNNAWLKIGYPDGGGTDVAELQSFNPIPDVPDELDPPDQCIFRGVLQKENSAVAVNGCPGDSNFEVSLTPHKGLKYHSYTVRNGTVTPFKKDVNSKDPVAAVDYATFGMRSVSEDDLLEEMIWNSSDDNGNMTSPAEDRNAMPTEMKINLVVHYDKEFWEMFRGGSLNQLRKIMNMAKILFSYPQLNTYIDIVVKKEYYISSPINPTQDLQKLVEFTADNHPDYADVYLYMSVLDQGSNVGGLAAGIGTVCAFNKGYRTAVVEYYKNDFFTANTVAHEIGHVIGLQHDFNYYQGNRVAKPPKQSQGKDCTNVGAIMDYFQNDYSRWSDCSRDDFYQYYNLISTKYGGFCLNKGCQSDGKFCGYLHAMATFNCEHSYFRQYCMNQCDLC